MKKSIYISILIISFGIFFNSCVETDIDDALDYDEYYKTSDDADKAVLGVYSSFMRLTGQMIILNELRSDLVDLTINSDMEFQEIDAKNPSSDNSYAIPTQFYNVIANCNDVLANFEMMYSKNRINETQFLERYSDILAIRCYVYIQLATHFGKIPYITTPVVNVSDLNKISKDEWLGIDDIMDKMIESMTSNTITGKPVILDPYSESPLIKNTLNGYDLSYYFINKRLLLGDLYLWRANDFDKKDYYELAAAQYKIIMDTDSEKDATNNYQKMKVNGADTWNTSSSYSNIYYQIFFLRYHGDDANSYNNQWVNIFSDGMTMRRIPYEWVWTMSYDVAYNPVYPFIELFATKNKGGNYQLKPSDYLIDDLWGTQKMTNGFTFDGRGESSSYNLTSEGAEIAKYLYQYDPLFPYQKQGRVFLYRASLIHLRYAEAVNRAGYPKLAYALVNHGLRATYGTIEDGYLIVDNPEPYYFACSYTESSTKFGYRREPWRMNCGIRGRVALVSKETSPFANNKLLEECSSISDSIKIIEKIIIDEAALECAFEGNRFPDLIRVSHRMNINGEDGSSYLQSVLSGKYSKNGRLLPDYSTEDKWFLPFFE